MLLKSLHSRGAAAESAPSPQTALIRAREALAGLESEYAEAIAGLPANDKPYATISGITNRVLEYFRAQIVPLKQNRDGLPPDSREEADELIKNSSHLCRRSHYLFTQIDQLLEISGEDKNLFGIDFEASVYREAMHDGAVEMHARILLPSLPSEDVEEVVALMEPLDFDGDLPFYALKNQLTGKRIVRLEKVTEEGEFYCNSGEPNSDEVLRYYKDLRSRIERLNTFKGLEDLLCECRGLKDYLNETESCSKLAEDVAALDAFTSAKGIFLFAKENGKIERLTPANSQEALKGIDVELAQAIMANADPKIMLTTVDGSALMLFSVVRDSCERHDFVLKPWLEQAWQRKNAYALFVDKLLESRESLLVLLSAVPDPLFDLRRDLYIQSPVRLVKGKSKAPSTGRNGHHEKYRIAPRWLGIARQR